MENTKAIRNQITEYMEMNPQRSAREIANKFKVNVSVVNKIRAKLAVKYEVFKQMRCGSDSYRTRGRVMTQAEANDYREELEAEIGPLSIHGVRSVAFVSDKI